MSIRELLLDRSVRFEFLLHRPAPTATHLAGSVHVPGRSVAKAVLVHASGAYCLAVLPATHKIDPVLLSRVLDSADLRIATEGEVEALFHDCEPGALPPFGRPYGISTVVDTSLAAGSDVVFMGNTRHEGVRMKFRDYEAIESPLRARFSIPTATPRPKPGRIAG